MKFCFTFGEFLNYIMKTRNISTSKLAEMTGNKSKTTIVRLLNDECSTKSIIKLSEKLSEVINLTAEEKRYMQRAIESEPVSRGEKLAIDNLLTLYGGSRNAEGMSCFLKHDGTKIDITIEEILSKCVGKNTKIIAEDAVNSELIFRLNDLIHKKQHDGCSLKISHFFYNDNDLPSKGKQILSLMSLSIYNDYKAYECSGTGMLIKRIVILTEKDGNYIAQIMEYIDNTKCHYIETPVTEDFYRYLACRRDLLISVSKQIRTEPLKSSQLIPLLEDVAETDKYPTFHIGKTPCFVFIPFEIQSNLMKKANFLGKSPDDPYIKSMYSVMENRLKFIKECGITRKVIFTEDGLYNFLQIGRTGDHFAPFDNLSPEERLLTMNNFLSTNGVHFKILKKDYYISDFDVFICAGKSAYIYNTDFGWWNGCTMSVINDKKMLKLITDFYNSRLWRNCCYNEDKSKKIVDNMIKSFRKEHNLPEA